MLKLEPTISFYKSPCYSMFWVVKMSLICPLSSSPRTSKKFALYCLLLKDRVSLNWDGLNSPRNIFCNHVHQDFRREESWGIYKVHFEDRKPLLCKCNTCCVCYATSVCKAEQAWQSANGASCEFHWQSKEIPWGLFSAMDFTEA